MGVLLTIYLVITIILTGGMLLALFYVILDEMKVTYGIVHSFEVKLLPYSWTVYYTTEEETNRNFQEKINSVFKQGLFIFREH